MNFIPRCIFLTIAATAICADSTASAQYTLTTLATFNGTNGVNPTGGLIADASGNLYGTTSVGGVNNDGTVFEVANDANHTLSTLATFNGTNGSQPYAGLIADASGNLYGTTIRGGDLTLGGGSGYGTVFKVANDANHTLSTVATFNGPNGVNPYAGLIADASGNLYGTTRLGGNLGLNSGIGYGTVFEVANDANHTLTTLTTFGGDGSNTNNGANPYATLFADSSGNLYGTTESGGVYNAGIVFKLANDSKHTFSDLAEFSTDNRLFSEGTHPVAGLVADTSGNLFGTTNEGGTFGNGTVFEVANGFHTGSNVNPPTTLSTFSGLNGAGANPHGDLIADVSGNLYGTTEVGGDLTLNDGFGGGTVFERSGTHGLSILATFNGTNGQYPVAGLFADADGNLYGTTEYGGDLTLNGGLGDGTVFELSPVPEPSSLLLAGLAGVMLLRLFVKGKLI